ncbi:MAG: transposase [Campylobacterota bacterium]|nr:transposase [Campylobacterota bacterium]
MENKYLPYAEVNKHCKFITFRTIDSEDTTLHEILNQPNVSDKIKQYQADKYLDDSNEGAYLNNNILLLLHNLLKSQDTILYDLVAYTIMPNHIHLLMMPKKNLSFVVETIKFISQLEINKILNKNSQFWEDDYYIKNVSNNKQLDLVYKYFKGNSSKHRVDNISSPRFYSIYEENV